MICPRCGAKVADHKKFCGDCGSALPWRCSACGSENPADKRFCSDCGAAAFRAKPEGPPAPAAPQPSAELRQLTVMFVDLVGSTALGARLDPEDLRDVMAAYDGSVTGLVARFDGFVARYMGDGVLAYFGFPRAHEDDAERAIRTGLAIVNAVAQLATIAGPAGTLSARVAIASRLVMVGDLIGSEAIGDTPNLAARLQAAAEAGTVVISSATRRLTGDLFEYRELALPDVKGRRAPERAWVVLGESVIESRFEALRGTRLHLVGRTEELELLRRRWEQAKTGEGRVVLLRGEPGIGKSRLIVELEQDISTAHGHLRFLCSPHHQDTPLHPVIRQIERSANFRRGDSPTEKLGKLANSLSPAASSEGVGLLANLLSIPHAVADLPKTVTPQHQKAMTFGAIARQIASLARQTPILAILEDAHWADPTTLDLVDFLIVKIQDLPMLLVVTARPEVQPHWVTRPHVTVQLLSALDQQTAASLIKQVASGRKLPGDVVDRIMAHADGVPLFIEELTQTVLEKGLTHGDGERVSPTELVSPDVVPTSLRASLMQRLDRLPAGKEVAQIGAVIGREFSFEMLQALSPIAAKSLERALGELAQAGIIIAHGQPPWATYTFKHALLQDAVYASLLRDHRRAIHLRLAEKMEKDTAGVTPVPELIAWHFAEAGAPDRSINFYMKAAKLATGRFALAEIVSHLRNGLRQTEALPDSADKQRRKLELLVALGRALIDHKGSGNEEVRATFERARELCLALDEVQLLPRVYDGLMLNYHFTHSEPQKMIHYASEMIAVCQRTGDRRALLMARRGLGLANMLLGRFERAREEMQLVVDMYETERDSPHAGMSTRDPKVSICTVLGACLTVLGYPDSGAAMSLAGVKHAETLNHVISLILGLRRACVQGMLQRNTQRVIELSSRLVAVGTAYETFKGSRDGAIFHAWAELRTRSEPLFFNRMQAALEQLDSTKSWALLPFFMACAAELSGQYGDVGTAVALLNRAAELVGVTGERWCEPEIMRLQARFSARDPGEAATLLQATSACGPRPRVAIRHTVYAVLHSDVLAQRCGNVRP